MKKLNIAVFAIVLVLMLTGCTHDAPETKQDTVQNEEKKISIVTTIFPEYDWICELLGEMKEQTDVTMLLDNGVDLHSYQPTTDDIVKISECDLFIYVGGESDEWVEDALNNVVNKDRKVLNLLDVLQDTVKEEETVEGMQAEEESDAEDENTPEYDEHVWLSIKNAGIICEKIVQMLEKLDPVHKDIYSSNYEAYRDRLNVLDQQYQDVADHAKRKTVLFGDRFPFRYLVDDYHIKYYAAFVGCSAETEASFNTIRFLAEKVDALDLPCVLTIEGSQHEIAKTIVQNTQKKNQKIITMNSMQSITASDLEQGVSYISIMEHNLDALKTALN